MTFPILAAEELLARAEHVRQSLASLRLEALTASAETLALADQYARGELTLETVCGYPAPKSRTGSWTLTSTQGLTS